MRRVKNAIMWSICLGSGAIVGIFMVPVELAVMVIAKCLGAKDVRWSELGFVFRQFTDIRSLRLMYPLDR